MHLLVCIVFIHLCAARVCLRVFSPPPRVCSDGWGLATVVSAPGEQSRPQARGGGGGGGGGGGTVVVNSLTWPSVYSVYTPTANVDHTHTRAHTHTHTHTHKLLAGKSQTQRGAEANRDRAGLVCLRLFYLFASSPYQRGKTEPHACRRDRWHRVGKKQNCSRRDGGGCRVSGWRPGEEIARRKWRGKETITRPDKRKKECQGPKTAAIYIFFLYLTDSDKILVDKYAD